MPEDLTMSKKSASSQKDRELVSRALKGDQTAYALLVKKYKKGLILHIKRTIGVWKPYHYCDWRPYCRYCILYINARDLHSQTSSLPSALSQIFSSIPEVSRLT